MLTLKTIRAGLFNGNGIARRLTALVIVFSTLIAVFTTGIQLVASYRVGLHEIEDRLHEIESTQVPAIERSVWALDGQQLAAQIEGLVKLPDIESIVVRTDDRIIGRAGNETGTADMTRIVRLTHLYRGQIVAIGSIEISITFENLYRSLFDQFLTILITNTTKTLFVALFMLIVFQWLVTRHLYDMAAFARGIDPMKGGTAEVTLDRRPAGRLEPDAIEVLATTLNSLNRRIAASYEALKASEQEYLRLFMDSPIGLFRCAPDGRFLKINPALASLLGDPSPESTGARVAGLRDGLLVGAGEAGRLLDMLAVQDSLSVELRVRRADGTEAWAAITARAVRDADGTITHIDGSIQDIDARIQGETALREARDTAMAASQAKSQFLANMSHELRTPLNAVIGYSEALELGVMGAIGPAQRHYVHCILVAGRHLLSMVDDLLDLARIEAGKASLDRIPCRIDAIIADCVREQAVLAQPNRIAVVVDTPPLVLPVDARSFGQIVRNLLSNAIKFNRPDGRVTLTAGHAAGMLTLTVADTGIGMPQETLADLFEPFRRGNAEISRPGEGTGLGLAITRRLVELYGGDIAVRSSGGHGTTVEVALPVGPAVEAVHPTAHDSGRRSADDDALSRPG